MAITLLSSLYPPMFNSTFLPAFPVTNNAIVYFSLSPFNSSSDIARVHISVVNQATNENALTESTGILLSEGLQYDTDKGMYYVMIPADKIKNENLTGWNHNQLYQVQLRFDNWQGGGVVNNSDYFISHLANFSEWSSIVLLRPIVQPEILLRTFDTNSENKSVSFNKGIIPISGGLYFGNGTANETETLQSYKIQVLSSVSETVLLESETIYTGGNVNPNVIEYRLDLTGVNTESSNSFILRAGITTKNNYRTYKDYKFTISDYVTEDTFDPKVSLTLDRENGIATVHVKNVNTVFGTLYIKRSSSISNFKKWENIYSYPISGAIDLDVADNTIGSGIWYRYAVQLENVRGAFTPNYYSDKFFPDFYDAIFSRKDRQIAVKFNYKVSSFKPVVNRQKVDTLGGRYPKFTENAILNYHQFSISGTISTQEDENELFLSKKAFFGDEYDNYIIYEKDEYRDGYHKENYNYLWERGFREELVKWLNDGEPKLYRSMTEGLMVVMLTDVNLTPNATLSRRLYDFTATVYEIADGNSLETLDELGVYDVVSPRDNDSGDNGQGPDPTPEYVVVSKPGQLFQESITKMVGGKVDIVSNAVMARLREKYGGVLSGKNPSEGYLKNVKIFFHSKPHMFIQTSSGLQLVTDPGNYNEEDRKRIQLGYSFEVNNQGSGPSDASVFFVNSKGYYQIPDSIDVTSLFFPQLDDVVTVEYIVTYKEKNSQNSVVSGTTVEKTLVGQEQGVFFPYKDLGERIRAKYSFVVPGSFYQKMQWWKGISVDVTPFSMLDIRYHGDAEYETYEVGDTGVLHLLRRTPIDDIRFIGRRMRKVDSGRIPYAQEWEYGLDESGTDYLSDSAIGELKEHTVYLVNGKYRLYVNQMFYDMDVDKEIAAMPVEGYINYYGDIIRNSYV